MAIQEDTVVIEQQTNRWLITDINLSLPTSEDNSIILNIAKGYNDGVSTVWHSSNSYFINDTDLVTLYAESPVGSNVYDVIIAVIYDYAKSQDWIPTTAIDEVI